MMMADFRRHHQFQLWHKTLSILIYSDEILKIYYDMNWWTNIDFYFGKMICGQGWGKLCYLIPLRHKFPQPRLLKKKWREHYYGLLQWMTECLVPSLFLGSPAFLFWSLGRGRPDGVCRPGAPYVVGVLHHLQQSPARLCHGPSLHRAKESNVPVHTENRTLDLNSDIKAGLMHKFLGPRSMKTLKNLSNWLKRNIFCLLYRGVEVGSVNLLYNWPEDLKLLGQILWILLLCLNWTFMQKKPDHDICESNVFRFTCLICTYIIAIKGERFTKPSSIWIFRDSFILNI